MKKLLTLTLVLAMLSSLAVPTLAAEPTYTDVPESHWAYADVEAAAASGLMNGTGNGAFSPNATVSAAQFLTLVGRVVFPDVKAEGADWYGPYVSVAQNMGLLDGTLVDVNNMEAPISRYDIAVILQAAARVMGVSDKTAGESDVSDFLDIPNRYTSAVLAVYGMGLIRGDEAGKFNGANSMTRAEVAVVMNRLQTVKGQGATYRLVVRKNDPPQGVLVVGESTYVWCTADPYQEAPYAPGSDRIGFTCTSSNTDIVEITGMNESGNNWIVEAKGVGTATITITDPYGVSGSWDVTVVEQREGIGTMTRTVWVEIPHYETHTLKGNAYTEKTYLSAVPYEIRYTRDGGKTFEVVYEGVTPAFEEGDWYKVEKPTVEVELPSDAFYGLNSGVYVSIDVEIDGQRFVSRDLRLDGRGGPRLGDENTSKFALGTMVTPPEGEKLSFTFNGHLKVYQRSTDTYAGASNFEVKLCFGSGTVVGEAIANEGGVFTMECEMDVLDFPPNRLYRASRIFDVLYQGDIGGEHYEWLSATPTWSLTDLKVWNEWTNRPDPSRWERTIPSAK